AGATQCRPVAGDPIPADSISLSLCITANGAHASSLIVNIPDEYKDHLAEDLRRDRVSVSLVPDDENMVKVSTYQANCIIDRICKFVDGKKEELRKSLRENQ